MKLTTQLAAAARLDLAEVLRSRWIWFCVATYAVLAGVLVTVGARASTIVGFTGTSRALLAFTHAVLLILPLLALIALVAYRRKDGAR